jgi:serine/threonine protein kinase
MNEVRSRTGLKTHRVVDFLRLHISRDELLDEPLPASVTREPGLIRDALQVALQRKSEEIRASQVAGGGAPQVEDDGEGGNVIGANYEKWLDGTNVEDRREGEGEEVYCFVMPCADRNLSAAITHERFAGRGSELETIKLIANHVAKALLDMHSSNEQLVHCDVKPLNIVRVGQNWCLIDLDVACKIGSGFGSKKPSTGYCPPELAALLLENKHREYVADVACGADLCRFSTCACLLAAIHDLRRLPCEHGAIALLPNNPPAVVVVDIDGANV